MSINERVCGFKLGVVVVSAGVRTLLIVEVVIVTVDPVLASGELVVALVGTE